MLFSFDSLTLIRIKFSNSESTEKPLTKTPLDFNDSHKDCALSAFIKRKFVWDG